MGVCACLHAAVGVYAPPAGGDGLGRRYGVAVLSGTLVCRSRPLTLGAAPPPSVRGTVGPVALSKPVVLVGEGARRAGPPRARVSCLL